MKKIFFLSLCFFFASKLFSLPVEFSTGSNRIEFSGGFASYSENTGDIRLSTGAVIYQLGARNQLYKTIKSEDVQIKTSSSLVVFDTAFSIEDSSGVIKASKGFYNYDESKGEIENGTFYLDKFIFRGKRIDLDGKKHIYKKASVTTCDLAQPHYHISSSRIYLIPDKMFLAYNNFFYIGKVPVFYFPFIYKPIGAGTPVLSQFYPGYDKRNGFFIKSNFIYKFNKYTKLKLFVDYFSRKGIGTGTEIDYFEPGRNKTSLAFYRIREYESDFYRWGLNGGLWHSLKSGQMSGGQDMYGQIYFRLLSDPKFNNDFFRSNPFAISSDKQAGAAVTYKTATTVSRLSAYSRYVSTASDTAFSKVYESVPRFDFQTVPLKFKKIPFLNTYSAYLENSADNTDYRQKKAGASWNASRQFQLYRDVSFYPDFFYNQSVLFSTSTQGSTEWTGRYGADLNLRYSRDWWSLDLQYYTLRRNAVNKMRLDRASADGGIEQQYLSSSLFMIKDSSYYARLSSKYDIRNSIGFRSFNERLDPISFEVYKKTRGLELFLQESYSLREGNKNFIAQVNSGDERNYFNMGLANYSDNRSRYIISNGVGFVPPIVSSWRAEFILRETVDFGSKKGQVAFFEKSMTLYKDFHDFRTKFNFRVRKDVSEFFFYVTLKMNDSYRRDDIDRQADYFWRPWRREGEFRE